MNFSIIEIYNKYGQNAKNTADLFTFSIEILMGNVFFVQ